MQFKKWLLELSLELERSDIKALKFLLGDKIPRAKLERVAVGCDLFELLLETELMSISLLKDLMHLIGRQDLEQKITQFPHTGFAATAASHNSTFPPCSGKGELSALRIVLYRMAEEMNDRMVEEAKFIEPLERRDDIADGIDVMNYFLKKKPICSLHEIPDRLVRHRDLVELYHRYSVQANDEVVDCSGRYESQMPSLFPSYRSPTFPTEYLQSTSLTVEQCYASYVLLNGIFAEFHTGIYKEKPIVVKSLINSTATQQKELQMTVYLRHPFLLSVIRAEIKDDPEILTLKRVNLVYPMDVRTSMRLTGYLQRPPENFTDMEQMNRIRILYQISDALNFLHTEVEHIRGPVVHMGLRPCNILVDRFTNALLGDIDVAVEIPDEATHRSVEGIEVNGYTDRYKEIERRRKPSDDIFSLGIVILQVLKWQTEVFPDKRTLFDRVSELVFDQTRRLIKEVGKEEIEAVSLTEDFFDASIWESGGEYGRKVGQVALKCLLHPDSRITAAQSMSAFKDILTRRWCHLWESDETDERCIQCHFYDKSNMLKTTSDSCTERCMFYNRFCRECHYFSFRNPLHCPMHGTVFPMIGSPQNFAILIGGYAHDSYEQRAFRKDVDYVKRVVTDPRIMNIRSENVLEAGMGNIEKMSKLEDQVMEKTHGRVDFLFVYYSGHGKGDGSIQVTDDRHDDDVISIKALRELLERVQFKRLLVLLDCCFAARMNIALAPAPRSYEWLMILYSSNVRESASCNTKEGSVFTRYFVAGLQSSQTCLCEKATDAAAAAAGRNRNGGCSALRRFRAKAEETGFIKLQNLIEYTIDENHGLDKQEPVKHFSGTNRCSDRSGTIIAYFNRTLVTYNFRFVDTVNGVEIPVQLEEIDHSAVSLEEAVIRGLREEIKKYVPSVDMAASPDFYLKTEMGKQIATVEEFKKLALRNECFRVYLKGPSI